MEREHGENLYLYPHLRYGVNIEQISGVEGDGRLQV